MRSTFVVRGVLVSALSFAVTGCYGGDFLQGLPCRKDDECAKRSFCDAGLCAGQIAERGPSISLERPTDVRVADEMSVVVAADYAGMNLADPEDPPEKWPFAHGYVELELDGTPLGNLVDGEGTQGRSTASFEIDPQVATPGLHLVTARALDLEGAGWDSDETRDFQPFWIHDGTAQLAVIQPSDGATAPRTQPLRVTVSVANFALRPAPAEPPTGAVDQAAGQLVLFMHLDFPDCDPTCSIDAAELRTGVGAGGGGNSREITFELETDRLPPGDRETVTMVFALVHDDDTYVLDAGGEILHQRVDLVWK